MTTTILDTAWNVATAMRAGIAEIDPEISCIVGAQQEGRIMINLVRALSPRNHKNGAACNTRSYSERQALAMFEIGKKDRIPKLTQKGYKVLAKLVAELMVYIVTTTAKGRSCGRREK